MIALANVRDQWTTFLAAFLAVAAGVGLITMTLVVHDSAAPRVQPRLAAATALAVPPQATNESGNPKDRIPWDEAAAHAIATELAAVPGVSAAVVDRAFYAQPFLDGRPVADEAAAEAGHGWSSLRLGSHALVAGGPPNGPDHVVVDAALGVAVGSTVRVNLSAGPQDFVVSGTVNGPGVYFSDEQALQRDPGVRAIGLLVAPPASMEAASMAAASVAAVVERAAGAVGDRGSVLAGDDRAAIEPEYVAHRRFLGTQLITAMATLSLFTTVFVVASTLSLATARRRREIGLLRTIGAEPRQIRRMILGEAAVVGAVGAAAGCVVGIACAPLLRLFLLRLEVAPPDFVIRLSAWPLLTAAATGVGIAVLGAWAASRTAARVAPIEALLDAAAQRRPMTTARWIAGGTALAAGIGCAVMTAAAGSDDRVTMALGAAMCLIVAAALLTPVVIGPLAGLVATPFIRRSDSAGPMLLRAELLGATRRAAGTAAPVIAAVGFAVLLSGVVETMAVAYPAAQTEQLAGQVLITSDGTPGLSDAVVREVGAGPVGTRASLPTRLFLARPDGGTTVVTGIGTLDPRYARPGQAVLGESMARSLELAVGQTTSVRFVDGRTEQVQIAQVLPDDPARGAFVLPRELVRAHDVAAMTDDIFLPHDRAPTSVSAGAVVRDAQSYALADYHTDARLTTSLAMMLIVISVGYSGLAVANGMAMAARGRRADLAVLAAAGGTVRQLLSIIAAETALVATVGAVLGMLVTIPPLAAMAAGLSQATSTPVSLQLDGATVTAVVVGCLVLAIGASVAVGWRVVRGQAR